MSLFHRTGSVSRHGTAAGTGALAVLLLVGICGSPAYTRWAGTQTDPDSAAAFYVRLLAWPAWRLDADGQAGGLLAADLRAILLVVLAVALLYLLPAAQVARVPGSVSQFFSGWAAYVLAGGLAAVLAAPFGPDPSLLGAFQDATTGAGYGFLSGWIIGTASLGGRA
ncbi:hypothetical protein DKT68_23840 [Micromonospora acroterricola]|uniref:Uncharacterized protein n=1 Tax=Micromonospora acroterricola TaxID=2202421 RepID=A0A317CV94_9ACTN|nr:hypothetical protein [Micromonospora acroterricola]PWR06024.1 hypothetical protein DKT68_23840 [Micromonospora acroterricola]